MTQECWYDVIHSKNDQTEIPFLRPHNRKDLCWEEVMLQWRIEAHLFWDDTTLLVWYYREGHHFKIDHEQKDLFWDLTVEMILCLKDVMLQWRIEGLWHISSEMSKDWWILLEKIHYLELDNKLNYLSWEHAMGTRSYSTELSHVSSGMTQYCWYKLQKRHLFKIDHI